MSFKKSYSAIYSNITPEQIWSIWSNIEKRPLWDDDTEWAKIEGEFSKGNTFLFKPNNGPKLTMHITESTVNKSFTDSCKFPLAQLCGVHELKVLPDGLELTTTIIVKGLLAWFWARVVARGIVASLPHQTDLLVKVAREAK